MKNKKKMWLMGIIVLTIIGVIGITYAFWSIIITQEDSNLVETGCFKIEFQDENAIQLEKVYPITNEEGMKLTPYTFTITNICDTYATYQINLEEITTELKRLSNQYIKVSLNDSQGKILSTYEEVEPTLEQAVNSHKLTTGVLRKKESKTFNLRLWMDEDTPAMEEVMNATHKSKITVITVYQVGMIEVTIAAAEYLDGIKMDMNTVSNEKNEKLIYYYQLENEEEIRREENTYTFSGLPDGKYKVRGRVEREDGIILEEKEMEISIAYERVYVSNIGNDEIGNGAKDNPYATLQSAYNKVKSGGEILLLSDITTTSTTSMNIASKSVTLKSEGANIYTITKSTTFTNQILDIMNANNITITNIVFDGKNRNSKGPLIESRNSTVNLNSGTTIKNNINIGNYNRDWKVETAFGGGIYVSYGTLNLNGAIISNNQTTHATYSQGGGIYVTSTNVTMQNSQIIDNIATGTTDPTCGGGIMIWTGNFTMNSGSIERNKANYG